MTEQEKMPSVVHWGAVTNDPKAPSWFQGGAQYIRRDIVDGLVEALTIFQDEKWGMVARNALNEYNKAVGK